MTQEQITEKNLEWIDYREVDYAILQRAILQGILYGLSRPADDLYEGYSPLEAICIEELSNDPKT